MAHYLGTAIKISAILNIDTADTAVIKIEDPNDVVKVDSVAMTKEANAVYYYIYQSTSTNTSGKYTITITITTGSYTAVTQTQVDFVSQ